jgi:hypothetical protein
MTTTLKELKSHKTPPCTNTPSGHTTAPAMQAIVVNSVSIVEPQLASVIGYELEVVTPAPEDSQATSPTNCKVIATSEPGPPATCVAVVHHVLPASMCGSATIEVLAAPSLAEVVNVLPEEASTISGGSAAPATTLATGTHNNPSVSSVRAVIPEEHPSMTTTLEELNSHKTPPTTNIPFGHSSAPAVQAIVINCVSIVKPQLASIIRNELEVVTAALEDSQTTSPSHCEVIATSEPGPSSTCVAIVHDMFPASMCGPAPIEVLAATPLTKVIDVLPEKASTVSGASATITTTA